MRSIIGIYPVHPVTSKGISKPGGTNIDTRINMFSGNTYAR